MSQVVSQGACSKCGSSDAYTLYSDGHGWCYSCTTYFPAPRTIGNMKKQLDRICKPIVTKGGTIINPLPNDCSSVITGEPLRWLRKYGLTDSELYKNGVVYSPYREMLIFPSYDREGNLQMWQGRYFPPRNPKCYTEGDPANHLHIVHPPEGSETGLDSTIVLVEDPVSTLKVGRVIDALCLFGSHVSPKLVLRLKQLGYERVIIWLDFNKAKTSFKFRDKYAPLFNETRSVVTELDPKEYSTEEIKKYLTS